MHIYTHIYIHIPYISISLSLFYIYKGINPKSPK